LRTLDGGFEDFGFGLRHVEWVIRLPKEPAMSATGYSFIRAAAAYCRNLFIVLRAGVGRGRKIMAVI
jgi:hypothetical protein